MNRWMRKTAAPALAIAISLVAGCGTTQNVSSGGPAAPAQEDAATTKAAAPKAPTGTPLGDMTSVGSAESPQRGTLKMNTKVYDDSIFSNLGCNVGTAWDFDLNREFQSLTATLGVDDYALPEDIVTVTVLADNAPISQSAVSLGVTADLNVSVANVLRLRVEITRRGGGCIGETGFGTNVGFGAAILAK